MATQKARFQAALTHSTQYKDLFNLVIDGKIESLAALAQHAEDSWWSLAAAEFDATGGIVGAHPTAVANLICANAATLMNNILADLSALVGDTDVKTVATVWGTGSALKTLYAPFVTNVTDALLAKMLALRTLLAQAYDSDSLDALMVTSLTENIHEWAYNAFIEFGPNFPEVLTSFHSMSTTSETYNHPYLDVAITSNDIVLLNRSQKGEVALAWDPNTGGVAPLVADDKVYINALTVDDTIDISEAIQTLGLSVETINGGTATIQREDRELFETGVQAFSTDSGVEFGDIFEIRIIERAPAE